MTPKEALERAVAAVGGTRASLARLLGITTQAVNQWNQAPVARVLEIERLTGISRHDLRPDLYPRETPEGQLAEPKRGFRSEPATPPRMLPPPYGGMAVRPDGTGIVPATVMAQAGYRPGDNFVPIAAGQGDVRLLTGEPAITYARKLVRESIPPEVDLVEELRELRRRQFEREERLFGEGNE